MKNADTIPKLTVVPGSMGVWMPLLGSGIGLTIVPGTNLETFLCERLNISPAYLDQRVQTILVNHRAIDDLERVHIADGDAIALSAAMPGLAGATLRRGGHLSAMRSEISQGGETTKSDRQKAGIITLKLFNLVAREIGPALLAGSIWLKKKDWEYLLVHYPELDSPYAENASRNWIPLELLPQV